MWDNILIVRLMTLQRFVPPHQIKRNLILVCLKKHHSLVTKYWFSDCINTCSLYAAPNADPLACMRTMRYVFCWEKETTWPWAWHKSNLYNQLYSIIDYHSWKIEVNKAFYLSNILIKIGSWKSHTEPSWKRCHWLSHKTGKLRVTGRDMINIPSTNLEHRSHRSAAQTPTRALTINKTVLGF